MGGGGRSESASAQANRQEPEGKREAKGHCGSGNGREDARHGIRAYQVSQNKNVG